VVAALSAPYSAPPVVAALSARAGCASTAVMAMASATDLKYAVARKVESSFVGLRG
jgi:hypothetical protein